MRRKTISSNEEEQNDLSEKHSSKKYHRRKKNKSSNDKRILRLFIGLCVVTSVIFFFFFFFRVDHENRRHTIRKSTLHDPSNVAKRSKLIPERLITVVGQESSGTRLVTQTIARALNISSVKNDKFLESYTNGTFLVQHNSLPSAGHCAESFVNVSQLTPSECECMIPPVPGANPVLGFNPFYEEECKTIGVSQCVEKIKSRSILNPTSHINWYKSRGSIATLVIVTRDQSIESVSNYLAGHCRNSQFQEKETEIVLKLLKEAIVELSKEPNILRKESGNSLPSVVLVSYETLMLFKETYLIRIYKELGFSSDYSPPLNDGNNKYISVESLLKIIH